MSSSLSSDQILLDQDGQGEAFEDEDNGIYYDADGNVLDMSHVDWSKHEYVGIANHTGVSSLDGELVSAGRVVALVFFAVIFVVGVLGNSLVVYTVGRQISMRKVTYLYLLNLSAANLLYLVICVPTLSVSHTLVSWPFGNILCHLTNYVMSVSMAVSVLTITATGFDRYLAVIYPVDSRLVRTTKRAVVINISCWLLALVIMTPRIFLYNEKKVFHIVSTVTVCHRVERLLLLQIDTVLNFVLMYLLPLSMLSVFHFKIGQRLWHFTKPGTRSTQGGNMQVLVIKDRRRIAKIVFAITLVFAVGWLPIHVYHIAEDFNSGHILFDPYVYRGTLVLLFSFGVNSLNPILYCMLSHGFRQSFKKVLGVCAERSPRTVHVQNHGATQSVQNVYRRPPPVLLPRPATTTSEAFLRPHPNIHINIKQTTPLLYGASMEFCVNNLEAVQEVNAECSPLSITKEPLLELRGQKPENNVETRAHNSTPNNAITSPVISSPNDVSEIQYRTCKSESDEHNLLDMNNFHCQSRDSERSAPASSRPLSTSLSVSIEQFAAHNEITRTCRDTSEGPPSSVTTTQASAKDESYSKLSDANLEFSLHNSSNTNSEASQQHLSEQLLKHFLPRVD
uniref:G-protein coupled receptors family 1 profile domain-containing protein n=1 Tax=Biomphalaria glabrata TaxID=6526 RepID=A0A2C9LKS8_BIOGL